jgi:hypothetical protein
MSMNPLIRSATREDADVCGEICYRAFCAIADQHNFPHEFPALEVAVSVVTTMISKPGFYGIVAELDGRIAGSNFMDERSPIAVRLATEADLKICNELCFRTHGHDRGGELRDSIKDGSASVVEHQGSIVGYASGIGYGGHAVAESNDALKALISAAPTFLGAGFLVPSRNGDLLRWCFSKGLRLMQQMSLMTVGLYNEPKYPYLPSILY